MTGGKEQGEIGSTPNGVHIYGTIGVLSEFKPDGNRTVYQERMEQYVPLLITCMGEQAYIMLNDLFDPITPAKSTYTNNL